MHILIVDDDADILEFLADVLGDAGHEVVMCSDWTQIQVMVTALVVDVIFLDRRFHGRVVGDDLIEALRADPYTTTIPIIYSTSEHAALTRTAQRWQDYKVIPLPKPFSLSALFQALNAANQLRLPG